MVAIVIENALMAHNTKLNIGLYTNVYKELHTFVTSFGLNIYHHKPIEAAMFIICMCTANNIRLRVRLYQGLNLIYTSSKQHNLPSGSMENQSEREA